MSIIISTWTFHVFIFVIKDYKELTKQNLIINFVDFQFSCGSKLIKFCHVRFIRSFKFHRKEPATTPNQHQTLEYLPAQEVVFFNGVTEPPDFPTHQRVS